MKYKIIWSVIFSLLITACNKKKDNNTIGDITKVRILLNDFDSSKFNDIEKEKILDTLQPHLFKYKNDSLSRDICLKVADKYYYLNKFEKYKDVTAKLLDLSIKKRDTFHIAKSLYYLGDYYDQKAELDSAFRYYSKSEKIYTELKDSLTLAKVILHKARVFLNVGIYSQCEIETVKALKLLSKSKNTELLYASYNLMAISLKEVNNYQKSLEYFELALEQLDKLGKENFSNETIIDYRITTYNNIGRVYEKLKNYRQAIFFYNKGLSTKNIKYNYLETYAMLLNNIGYSKIKLGDTVGVDKLLFESLKIRNNLNFKKDIAASKIDIGEYYLFVKDTAKALFYIKDGLQSAKKCKSSLQIVQALDLLMKNDGKNEKYYTTQYIKVKDSLQQLERITKNKFARIAYETDQIEEENQVLTKQITYIFIGSVIVIFIFGAFFIIYRLKSKNKELILIKEQQEANEKIYKLMLNQQAETETARNEERNRIAMELHDGIVNRIFTTRYNLMQLEPHQEDKKELLINELINAENEIRRVSHDLQQNLLFEDAGLSELITKLIADQQNEYNTKFDLTIDKYIDWTSVPGENKIQIYRIVQEAIQNVNKYSKATKCYVLIMKKADKITIRIWDNGIGFNPDKVKKGIGLKNIAQRTEILNGGLKITSSPGNGTTVEVVF